MTFSHRVKHELLEAKETCQSCAACFVHGYLFFSGNAAARLKTEQQPLVEKLCEILRADGKLAVKVVKMLSVQRQTVRFALSWEEPTAEGTLLQGIAKRYQNLSPLLLAQSCCLAAWLRGVFLACGGISDPQKEYHLEFQLKEAAAAALLAARLAGSGHPFHHTTRKGMQVLYLKESEQIEEVLTYLGAVSCVFELMNIKIEKELRNHANRVTNCETANIQKTVDASLRQVEDIRLLEKSGRLATLDEVLKQTAMLRLSHPEDSLSELAAQFPGGVSRSGLNHRLKKLSALADEMRASGNG